MTENKPAIGLITVNDQSNESSTLIAGETFNNASLK